MHDDLTTAFLHYARLDRQRSRAGLSASEKELWTRLRQDLTTRLYPSVPAGAERRASLRVPSDIHCRWARTAPDHDALVTTLSRTGAFVRTAQPAPIGEAILLRIDRPDGGTIEIPATVANHFLGMDPLQRGMGVRFESVSDEAMRVLDALYQRSIISHYAANTDREPRLVDLDPSDLA